MLSSATYSDSETVHPEISRIIHLIDDTALHTHRLGLEMAREAQPCDYSGRDFEIASQKLS